MQIEESSNEKSGASGEDPAKNHLEARDSWSEIGEASAMEEEAWRGAGKDDGAAVAEAAKAGATPDGPGGENGDAGYAAGMRRQ